MKRWLPSLLRYEALIIGSILLLFPMWWMIVVSLSDPGEALAATANAETFSWIPTDPQWQNYGEALKRMGSDDWTRFFDALANTIVITTCCVVGQVLSCGLVGYAFARLHFRGRGVAFILMLSTMMLPAQVTMIPVFILFRTLGWVDTLLPLIVPAFFGNAFFIFLYRQFFAQIPEDLLDAARIDGASHFAIWWRIMMPMCMPVMAITAIFTFMGTWNDFMGPLIYLHDPVKMTLAVALNAFKNQYGTLDDVHLLMAASIVTMIPCVLLFFVAQRYFIQGLNLGAVKG